MVSRAMVTMGVASTMPTSGASFLLRCAKAAAHFGKSRLKSKEAVGLEDVRYMFDILSQW